MEAVHGMNLRSPHLLTPRVEERPILRALQPAQKAAGDRSDGRHRHPGITAVRFTVIELVFMFTDTEPGRDELCFKFTWTRFDSLEGALLTGLSRGLRLRWVGFWVRLSW
jgi:hypothetical protein